MNQFYFNKLVLILLFCSLNILAQEKQKIFNFSGYLSEVNITSFQNPPSQWANQNLIHNRLNFDVYPNNKWHISLSVRNRILCGTDYTRDILDQVGVDQQGALDLSFNWYGTNKFQLNTTIDRLFASYETGIVKLQLGRQRINWSQCLIWNPNDLFNGYSFFDLDYSERSGTDAFRLAIFPNETSVVELVTNYNYNNTFSAAAMYMFNAKQFDFQFIAGMLQEQDATLGFGFSGDIRGVNIRGEATYFIPFYKETTEQLPTKQVIVATLGADYYFASGVSIAGQVLWNSNATSSSILNMINVSTQPFTPKMLSPSQWSVAAQSSYEISPRFSVSLAALYFIDLKGFYLTPAVNYNIIENLTLSLSGQYFYFDINSDALSLPKTHKTLLYARLQYNF